MGKLLNIRMGNGIFLNLPEGIYTLNIKHYRSLAAKKLDVAESRHLIYMI